MSPYAITSAGSSGTGDTDPTSAAPTTTETYTPEATPATPTGGMPPMGIVPVTADRNGPTGPQYPPEGATSPPPAGDASGSPPVPPVPDPQPPAPTTPVSYPVTIFTGAYTLPAATGGTVGVAVTVTQTDAGSMHWEYDATNDGTADTIGLVRTFRVDIKEATGLTDIQSSVGWSGAILGGAELTWDSGDPSSGLAPGATGAFTFDTPIRPVVPTGSSFYASAVYGGAGDAKGPGKVPTLTLNMAKTLIPVNADDDNGSPWKSADQPFIPSVRDFNATNLPKDDPELIPMTVTITGGYGGTISVSDYAPGEGTVAFWKDPRKKAAFQSVQVPVGQDPVTATIYVEGTHESASKDDTIRVDVQYAATTTPPIVLAKSLDLAVAPIINSLDTSIPTPSVSFTADNGEGLQGLWARKPPDTNTKAKAIPGITFTANVTAGSLSVKYLQDMIDVKNGANGSAAGFVMVAPRPNKNVIISPDSKATFPLLDALKKSDGKDPIYPFLTALLGADTVRVTTYDSPTMVANDVDENEQTTTIDVKEMFRMYLVVQYPDQSIYSIASVNWEVTFYATDREELAGVTKIQPQSNVTAFGWQRGNNDPDKTAGPAAGNVLVVR